MDRVLNGRWQHVGEPAFDAYLLRSRLPAAIKIAGSLGARVILATEPYNQRGEQPNGSLFPEDIPARVDAWNRLLRAVAAEQHLTVADFGSRVSPGGKFTWTVHGVQVRSDGVHLTPQGVQQWVAPWLFRVLLRSAP
jgi:lysophospholipase L1-like esterase